jgi:anaerobic selenocysteine-containing dehydrogenase
MVSMDIYLNETTRHADVILPGPSPLEDLHYDVAFPQLSWRNHARYSPPVFPARTRAARGMADPAEAGRHRPGQVPHATPMALDDAQFARRTRSACLASMPLPSWPRHPGSQRPAAHAGSGCCAAAPMATSWGRKPDGLTWPRYRHPTPAGGIDLGELQPRIPEMLRTPSGKVELAPPSLLQDLQRAAQDLRGLQRPIWSSSAGATCAPTTAGCTTCRSWPKARSAAPRWFTQGRAAPGPAGRRSGRHPQRQRPGARAGARQRGDDARRRQPAARLGPRRTRVRNCAWQQSAPAPTCKCPAR